MKQIMPITHDNQNNCLIICFIQPRASKVRIVGIHANELKIALTSPPVDGEANAALIKFLAKELKKSKSEIEIVSGLTSRHKVVLVKNIREEELQVKISNS